MFQVTRSNLIPCIVAVAYILGFSYLTEDIQWYAVPNAWIWLGVIPVGLGMWVKSSRQ